MSSISAEWIQLVEQQRKKSIFYRRKELYDMQWGSMDLSKFMIAGAPFGGPLAMIRDQRKIMRLESHDSRPRIYIYSSAGKLISEIMWTKGLLVYMGWSDSETLVCVVDDASVFMYDIHGKPTKQFSMGAEARESGIMQCIGWGNGICALTKDLQLIAVTDLNNPNPTRLADTGLTEPPASMELIQPDFTLSSNLEVLVAPQGTEDNGTIVVVDVDSAQDQLLTNGPFSKMAVKHTGDCLAAFTESGKLWVTSTDFSKNLANFNTKSKVPPRQLVWCGEDCVVCCWDPDQLNRDSSLLLMVGPSGAYESFTIEGPVFLVPEFDGLRIFSNEKCEFLQRVPNCTVDIFKIGSLLPAALLYDAYTDFEKRNASSIKNIRAIKNELAEAVDTCIEAAAQEFDTSLQRSLLKAASYGKSFCDSYDHDNFVEMCKHLRVLNAVRTNEVGIPITYAQYKRITPQVLIDRLVNRHQHLLAFRICEHLKMKPEKVLVHWACGKVRSDEADASIRDAIVNKLSQCPGVSYAEVASTAYRIGKQHLAILLLDHEPRAAAQVPLLLNMHQDEMALVKAIESGDTDLVYLVLLHMKKTLSNREFFRIIVNKPVARNLLETYCKEQDVEFLQTYYSALDMTHEAGSLAVLESYNRIDDETERKKLLRLAKEHYSKKKEHLVDAKATEDQIHLLEIQKELEVKTGQNVFVNTSISDTMYHAMLLGEHKKAAKIKSEFKVPDKRYWWIRIKALAKMGDWDELERFAKHKKSPIGYTPFVKVCIEQGNSDEAAKYIPKVADPQEKVELYISIMRFQEAIEVAVAAKSVELLQYIYNKSTNKQTQETIQRYVEQLS